MPTEFSLQILPFTTTTASDQDPFKTMLQKMKNRNLDSSIIFPDKFKSFRKVFFKAVQPIHSFSKLSPPVRRSTLAKEDRPLPSPVRYFFFIGRFPVRPPNNMPKRIKTKTQTRPLAKRDTSLDKVPCEADAIRASAREGKVGETNPQN